MQHVPSPVGAILDELHHFELAQAGAAERPLCLHGGAQQRLDAAGDRQATYARADQQRGEPQGAACQLAALRAARVVILDRVGQNASAQGLGQGARCQVRMIAQANHDGPLRSGRAIEHHRVAAERPRIEAKLLAPVEPALQRPVELGLGAVDRVAGIVPDHDGMAGERQMAVHHLDPDPGQHLLRRQFPRAAHAGQGQVLGVGEHRHRVAHLGARHALPARGRGRGRGQKVGGAALQQVLDRGECRLVAGQITVHRLGVPGADAGRDARAPLHAAVAVGAHAKA